MLRYIIICLSLLLFSHAIAQKKNIQFSHFTRESGLSNNTVETIFQDSYGFVWLGTADGLNRFDGYHFITYKNKPDDKTSISDNYINQIIEDHKKRLWIVTSSGINIYHRENATFSTLSFPDAEQNTIHCLTELHNGEILAVTKNGIFILNEQVQKFEKWIPAWQGYQNINHVNITCILQDNRQRMWIGTENNGLFLAQNNVLQNIANNTFTDVITCLSEYNDNIFVGTQGNGLLRFNSIKNTFSVFRHSNTDINTISSDIIKCIYKDVSGKLWLGTENGGLNLLDEEKSIFLHYQNDIYNTGSLSQKTVASILEDKQGNLWVGTHRGGVNFYSPMQNQFIAYTQGYDKHSLNFKDIKCFYQDKANNNIYIGTDGGGLNIWNPQTQMFSYFTNNPANPKSISSNAVLSITKDKEGKIWVGTWNGGLNLFDPRSSTFKHYMRSSEPYSISSNNVWCIWDDNQGHLWLGTSYGGLCLFDKKSGHFTRLTQGNNGSKLYASNIFLILQDKEKNIWLQSSDAGLICYRPSDGKFIYHFVTFKNEIPFPEISISTLFIDSKQNLWVSTSLGLYKYDYKTKNFYSYFASRPVKQETIVSMLEDSCGNFWCGSQNGILHLNVLTGDFIRYTTADGLQGLDFERNAALKTSEGNMLFGGYNGFDYFHPESIIKNQQPPPTYITQLWVNNKPTEVTNGIPTQNDILKIPYKNAAEISFEFAALNFIATSKNSYAYKLDGFDTTWHYTNQERKATYTNLNPGKYTFIVRGANNDGIWNNTPAKLQLYILPSFWQTWWFKTCVVLLIFSAIFFYFFLYNQLLRKELHEKRQEAMYNMQLDFFTYISHEFRTPLSLILGAAEKLQEQIPLQANRYYQLMQKNANRLSNLIKELMDFRKVETGVRKLHITKQGFNVLLKDIKEDFSSLAETKKISFNLHIIDADQPCWFDKQVIEKIILNLLNNAFKFTEKGGSITLEEWDNTLQFQPTYKNNVIHRHKYVAKKYKYIKVIDTGKGIPISALEHLFENYYRAANSLPGSGIGLAFVKSLVLLHKGFIEIYSEENKGTEFLIGFPCSEEDYSQEEKTVNENQTSLLESLEAEQGEVEFKEDPNAQELSKNAPYILIVEDNNELRGFLKDHFKKNYQIAEAANGMEGLKMTDEINPSLIISDLMMPVMDGLEMCQKIKSNETTAHIPFIILTAKDQLDSKIQSLSTGADFYFSKPVSLNMLSLTVKNIFTRQQKLKIRQTKDYQHEVRNNIHSVKDRELIDTLTILLENEMEEPELNVEFLCKKMGMSQSKLYKRIKEITGKSITDFVRISRLNKARQIITEEDVSIREVMERVGILSASYFTKSFKKEFGQTPSEFLKAKEKIDKKR